MLRNVLLISVLALLGLVNTSKAQVADIEEVWLGFMTSVDVNERWGIWNDFHLVPNLFFIHRHGINYKPTRNLRITVGYAHLYTKTSANPNFDRNEHRPWWQAQLNKPLNGGYSLNFRMRHDLRFREVVVGGFASDEWLFTHRFRFQVNLRKRINAFLGSPNYHINVRNEFHYNLSSDIPNGMDQNRSAVLLGHSKGKRTVLSGYMLRTFTNQDPNHALVLWVIQGF